MDKAGEERVSLILSSFCCTQDSDIETFLRSRAVSFEKLNKSRTYLIFDEGELVNGLELTVYGYFSIALKVLSVPDNVSNHVRKKLDGMNAKLHGKVQTDFPCYLIGQLARNSNFGRDVLTGSELVGYALRVIDNAVQAVGGRIVMIECHDDERLISFYKGLDFTEISRIPDQGCQMVQMIRRIC